MKLFATLCAVLLALIAMNALPLVDAAIDCEALGGLEECMRPMDTVNATGQFICRRRFVNGIGIRPRVQSQSLCIAKTWGKASDRCGCCEGGCPTVCGEPCTTVNTGPIDNGAGLGVYIYDWYSFKPSRMCVSPGRSLQLQQQNAQKWNCMEYPGWFNKMFGSNFDDEGNDKKLP